MSISQQTLRDYLQSTAGLDVSKIEDRTPLFSSGLIDSFFLVELVCFLEAETGRRFPPSDLILKNLDTVDGILAYCNRAI